MGADRDEVTTMPALAALAAEAEDHRDPPAGDGERYAGYGIMGLPFASGHVLAMRRFPASSVGPAYTSIWHRDPGGGWEFWQDQPDEQGCARYFSAALDATRRVAIALAWSGDTTLRLAVPELDFSWSATMASSPVTRLLNGVGSVLPERAWTNRHVLTAMGAVAGVALRASSRTPAGAPERGEGHAAAAVGPGAGVGCGVGCGGCGGIGTGGPGSGGDGCGGSGVAEGILGMRVRAAMGSRLPAVAGLKRRSASRRALPCGRAGRPRRKARTGSSTWLTNISVCRPIRREAMAAGPSRPA